MYKLIVFDLDGTLLDTLDDLTASVNAVMGAYGLPRRTREEVRSFVGNGIKKLLERAVGDPAFPDLDGAFEKFHTHYKAHCKDATKPYEGILPLLARLKALGIKTAVLSNKADYAVKLLAADYFPDLLCDAAGENEAAGIRRKPCPDALLALMARLGGDKKDTVYVGDSDVDIQTARNAGVDCISVTWGFKTQAFLNENGAKTLVHTPLEILSVCGLDK